MSKLLILPCSSEKVSGGMNFSQINDYFSNDQILNFTREKRLNYYKKLLSSEKDSEYFEKRRKFNNSTSQKVDNKYFNSCISENLKFMEAINRYDGILYDGMIRNKIINKINNGLHVLIISGFYGVLKYNDHILDYQLDIKKGGNKFWTVNNINSISNSILSYISKNNISRSNVTVILSDTYSKPLNNIVSSFKENLWDKADGYGHNHVPILNEYLS